MTRLGDLSEGEKLAYRCQCCRRSEQLYRDSTGIYCRQCGPSVRVELRTPNIRYHNDRED